MNMGEEEVEVWGGASRGCSHTHSCNPPGPEDASHSHTCFHTHTHLIIPDQQENDHSDSNNKKRSCGNREAVRKYREKKKARTAYLEDEVKRLETLNEHLVRKLQSQAIVETELIRLRTLLVEIQEKIDGELGGFSNQKQNKQCTGSGFVFKEGDISYGSGFVFKEDGCSVATSNILCEAARVECEDGQTLHDAAIHSFVPHSPPFSH
ncbi:PREDICTED: basic leucine zipper 24 isoform X1 [Camelina sativa]|uniref:Basic leucine zipper 24 isoform X1 n=1 Tax=Camelina sativa TaxID=90675 RepID=A0ABM0ZH29_CAMSA|nr:PREDICTED: basic leucine zipper 24 isoform X1 [Camelina sativa]XP_010515639.1 PREDICTED: basic leucine zipper 24 isoform X1 [Camelina sativa]XP_010515640.1 PREDICTED: basic leucine zipper 24 isoform X1 [Camelina sativa]XP_019082478.1 PREDICTED: basic leucine zipper 24 isoform X1 [Camelina sativa]